MPAMGHGALLGAVLENGAMLVGQIAKAQVLLDRYTQGLLDVDIHARADSRRGGGHMPAIVSSDDHAVKLL